MFLFFLPENGWHSSSDTILRGCISSCAVRLFSKAVKKYYVQMKRIIVVSDDIGLVVAVVDVGSVVVVVITKHDE